MVEMPSSHRFEEKLADLYEQFQRSECSFCSMAEQLGITTWDLYTTWKVKRIMTG